MADGDQEKVDFKVWIGVWGAMLGAFMLIGAALTFGLTPRAEVTTAPVLTEQI